MRSFLWGKEEDFCGINFLSWETVCRGQNDMGWVLGISTISVMCCLANRYLSSYLIRITYGSGHSKI